jgi:hypothetical protein
MPVTLRDVTDVPGLQQFRPETAVRAKHCSTVASLPKLSPRTFPFDFSSSNLNVGNSFPDSGSGTLFRKLLSPINPFSYSDSGMTIKRIVIYGRVRNVMQFQAGRDDLNLPKTSTKGSQSGSLV